MPNTMTTPNKTPIALALLMIASASQAQTGVEKNRTENIEEIVVIGNIIERSLLETRESIEVITDLDIQQQIFDDLNDLFNQSANVYSSAGGEGFGIRGIIETGTGGGTGEVLSYYIDNVAFTGFAKRFGPIDLWDVEQVEVLRGPQTTNVGRNALAGAVNITTKNPVIGQFEAAVRATLERYDTYRLEGMVNAPIGETLALRVAAQYEESDGFIKNATRNEDDFDARENTTARTKLLWAPTDDLQVVITGQQAETRRGNAFFAVPENASIDDRTSYSNLDDQEDYEADSAALNVSYQLNDVWKLRSITSYQKGDYDRFDDDDFSAEGGNAYKGRIVREKNWAQELRAIYVGERIKGSVGVYYTEVDARNATRGIVNLVPADVGVPGELLPFYPEVLEINIDSPRTTETTNNAIFAELDYELTDRITLNIGGRFEREDQKVAGAARNSLSPSTPLPDPVAAGQQATDQFGAALGAQVRGGITVLNNILLSRLDEESFATDTDYSAFLPQVGITYAINPDNLVSVFIKRGYRAGGTQTTFSGDFNEFDPETLTNYEIAFRSLFWDGLGTFSANAYYGDWEDQQVRVSVDGTAFNIVTLNSGASTIYGLETSLTLADGNGLTGYLNLGLSSTEFDKFESATLGDLSGNSFAFSPEYNASLGVNKLWPNGVFAGANVSLRDEGYTDTQNTAKLDDFTLLNARLGYQGEDFRIVIYGKNITDETYRLGNFLSSQSLQIVQLGDPRNFGIKFTKTF